MNWLSLAPMLVALSGPDAAPPSRVAHIYSIVARGTPVFVGVALEAGNARPRRAGEA